MTKLAIVAGLALSAAVLSAPAYAECNSICRAKCEATASLGHDTVDECIALWSGINAKFGHEGALAFEGKVGKSTTDGTFTDIDALAKKLKVHKHG